MKLTDEHLHDLVHALSTSERGYFVKYAKALPGKEGKRYLQLFNLLQQMKTFNQRQFDRQLKESKFPSHVYRIRHYLYHSLIDSLRRSNKKITLTERIMDDLQQAYTLQGKGLLQLSNGVAQRCEERAYTNGLFGLATEAVRVLHGNALLLYQEEGSAYETELQNRMRNYASMQERLLRATGTANAMLSRFRSHGHAQNDADREMYNYLFNEGIGQIQVPDRMDPWTTYFLLDAESILALCVCDPKKLEQRLSDAYQLMWSHLKDFDDKLPFASVMYAYLDTLLRSGKSSVLQAELQRLQNWLQTEKKQIGARVETQVSINLSLIQMRGWMTRTIEEEEDRSQEIHECFNFISKANKLSSLQYLELEMSLAHAEMLSKEWVNARARLNTLISDNQLMKYDITRYWEIELMLLFTAMGIRDLEKLEHQYSRLKRLYAERKVIPYRGLSAVILKHVSQLFRKNWRRMDKEWGLSFELSLIEYRNNSPDQLFWLNFEPVVILSQILKSMK